MIQNVIMNKFIDYDLYNGILHLKCAIMNILHALDTGEINEMNLGNYIPGRLLIECLNNSKWIFERDYDYTGKECNFCTKCTSPSGKLFHLCSSLFGQPTYIYEL